MYKRQSLKSKISGYFFRFFGWGFPQAWLEIISFIELKKAIDLNQKHAFPFSSSNSTFSLYQVDSGKSKPQGITPEYAWLSEIRWVDYPWIETTTQTQFLCCTRQMDFDADRL